MSTSCLNSLIHEEIPDAFYVVFLTHDKVYASKYLESIDEQCCPSVLCCDFAVCHVLTSLILLGGLRTQKLCSVYHRLHMLREHTIVVLFNLTMK